MGITKYFVELGPNFPFLIQAPIDLSYQKKKKKEERKSAVMNITNMSRMWNWEIEVTMILLLIPL